FIGTDILWKFSPVHPDFAPCILELRHEDDSVRHRRECDSPDLIGGAARETKRITRPDSRIICACRAVFAKGFPLLEQFLSHRRQYRRLASFGIGNTGAGAWPCPRSTEIAFWSGAAIPFGAIGRIEFPDGSLG